MSPHGMRSGERTGASSPFLGLPRTPMGWSAIGLTAAFFVFLGLLRLQRSAPGEPARLPSDPLGALLLLGAAASAIGGGVAAVLANALGRERSLFLIPALLLGLLVLFFTIGELLGG